MTQYTANIDGSFQTKSNISGWGFLIKNKKGGIIASDFGAVPNEFLLQYEQYAFAKMMEYVFSNRAIQSILVKTDLKHMAKVISEMKQTDLHDFIKVYCPNAQARDLDFSIEHISRKMNKEADSLAKRHIYELFTQEKKDIIESFEFGHPKLNFLQLPNMKYDIRSTSQDIVNRVMHALKRRHIFVKFDLSKNQYEAYEYVENKKVSIAHGPMISKNQTLEHFFLAIQVLVNNFKKALVFVLDKESDYHQMIGYTNGALSPVNSLRYQLLIESLPEVYIYWDKEKNPPQKKRSKSLKNEIQDLSMQEAMELLRKNSSKRIRQMMVSIYIEDFQKSFNRSPDLNEMQEIFKMVDEKQS